VINKHSNSTQIKPVITQPCKILVLLKSSTQKKFRVRLDFQPTLFRIYCWVCLEKNVLDRAKNWHTEPTKRVGLVSGHDVDVADDANEWPIDRLSQWSHKTDGCLTIDIILLGQTWRCSTESETVRQLVKYIYLSVNAWPRPSLYIVAFCICTVSQKDPQHYRL